MMVRRTSWVGACGALAGLWLSGCATLTVAEVGQMGQRGDVDALLNCWAQAQRDDLRIAVIEALSNNPQDERGRLLTVRQARSGSSAGVRLAAAQALSRHRGPEVVAALIGALADPYPAVRHKARTVLAEQGAAMHPALVEAATSHTNHLVRTSALLLLTRRARSHESLRPHVEALLMSAARSDEAPGVRDAAVRGLGSLAVRRARALLVELRQTDEDAGVRMGAERALARLGAPADAGIVAAVLPLKNDTGEAKIGRFCAQIADYMAARLSAAKVCQVVDRARMDAALAEMKKLRKMLYDGDLPNAPALGRFKLANQLVYGSVQRQGAQYTIVLNRMDVSTLTMIPGAAATVTGYRADLEQLKVKVTDRFIDNFR